MRVLGGQDLFAVDRFELHFALVVGEHDRGLAQIDRGRFHRAFVIAKQTHLSGGAPRFFTVPLSLFPGPLRFITRMLRLITRMLRLIARLLHRFPAGPRSFTLRLPHGVANVRIEVHVAHVNMEVLHLVVKGLHLLVEVFGVEVEAKVTLMLANFFLPELHRDLLLCVLAQDSQGNVCPLGLAAHQL